MGVIDICIGIGASLLAGIVSETVTWLLVTRKPEYKKNQAKIESMQEQLKKMKAANNAHTPQGKKGIAKLQETLQQMQQKASFSKFGSTILNAVIMIVLVSTLNNVFEGVVAGRLPFEPFALVRNITHRNLIGSDWYECSVIFFYILSSMAFRPTMQKIFGSAPKRGQSMLPQWALPPEEDEGHRD